MATAIRPFETAPFSASAPHAGAGNGHGNGGDHSRGKPSVLVIEDDPSVIGVFTDALTAMGVDVVAARDGRQALAAARRRAFNLWLLDMHLPDIHGLDVVRQLRAEGLQTPFIVVSSYATVPTAVQAIRLGALTCLEKPVRLAELCRAVSSSVASPALDSLLISEPRTPFERWCNFLIRLVTYDHDLKTDGHWAKHVGVSLSALRDCCKRVDVKAEDARNFARALRAITRSGEAWTPELVLNIDDRRTLKKFEERSGIERGAIPRGHALRSPTLQEFFDRQTWLPRDNVAVLAFEQRLLSTADPRGGPVAAALPFDAPVADSPSR